MSGAAEKIDSNYFFGVVSLKGKAFQIARQSSGVTGYIYHPLRGHCADGINDSLRKAFAGRVNGDDIWMDSAAYQFSSSSSCIGAKEFSVGTTVAPGVFPGVCNGGRDDFRSEYLLCLFGHYQTDGACAAVEIQDRFCSRQAGKNPEQSCTVLPLGPDLPGKRRGQTAGK